MIAIRESEPMPMVSEDFVKAMPKAELHVHLEGSIRPETLLALARRYAVPLPAGTLERLQAWYRFTDFAHFAQVYRTISACLRAPDDIEMVAREFLAGQAAQNILHTEVTYTPFTHWAGQGIPCADQLAAIARAGKWAAASLGVSLLVVVDIPRDLTAEEGCTIADWAIQGMEHGVIGLGLTGPEPAAPAAKFRAAFDRARSAGLHSVPHAGEHDGPASIWGALFDLGAERIGHGVRCLEDRGLVAELLARRTPLEVCPTSNTCLGVARSWAEHPLAGMLEAGLEVTLNSDDPCLFGTSLTEEYLRAARTLGLDSSDVEALSLRALRGSFLPPVARPAMEARFRAGFAELRGAEGNAP
jgi:adenosine deaminase